MAKLKDLAVAELSKSADQKAIDALMDKIEKNEQDFSNDLFAAKQAVKDAKKVAAALESNPSARAYAIVEAEDAVKEAEATLAQITAIQERRF